MAPNVKTLKEVTSARVLVTGTLENTVMKVRKCHINKHLQLYQGNLWIVFKSVSTRKPGRTRQEVIQLKSPISFKLGTNVGFGE